MSKSSRRRKITDALIDIRVAGRSLGNAERHLEELAQGIPALVHDGQTGRLTYDPNDQEYGRQSIADPTGNAATAVDAQRSAERRLDRAADALARAAAELRACVSQAIAVATPTPEQLAELEAKAEPGCEIVGRIPRPNDGPNYWEPVERTSDFGGLLPRPYALGSWAREFVRRNGRLPNTHETTAHCENRRVMVKA